MKLLYNADVVENFLKDPLTSAVSIFINSAQREDKSIFVWLDLEQQQLGLTAYTQHKKLFSCQLSRDNRLRTSAESMPVVEWISFSEM